MTMDLIAELGRHGYPARLIELNRLEEARREIAERRARGEIDRAFDREWLRAFRFKPPSALEKAETVVLAACPQPQTRFTFYWKGKPRPIPIPPTYAHDSDGILKALLQRLLAPLGFRVATAALPVKLLAVRSGLAAYGKNNITYIDGLGSFYRLVAFFTDYPAAGASRWQEPKMMDACRRCMACRRNCPTGAIDANRFLLRAERCLTYFNERPADFPRWIDPAWHRCLFGCMRCQAVCPANRRVLRWVEDGPSFNEDETGLLLQNPPFRRIPASLKKKFERFSWSARGYGMLPRNIRAVLRNAKEIGDSSS